MRFLGGYGFLGVGKNFIFNFDPIEFKDPQVFQVLSLEPWERESWKVIQSYLPNLQCEGGFHVENSPAVWCYPKVVIYGISIGAQDQAVRRDRQWAIGRMP